MEEFAIIEIKKNSDNFYIVAEENGKEVTISGYSIENAWNTLFQNINLSEQFIEEHLDKVDWETICENQKLSEEFIEKHRDEINWEYVSAYQTLSEQFISNHRDKISIQHLAENNNAKVPEDMKVILKMRG